MEGNDGNTDQSQPQENHPQELPKALPAEPRPNLDAKEACNQGGNGNPGQPPPQQPPPIPPIPAAPPVPIRPERWFEKMSFTEFRRSPRMWLVIPDMPMLYDVHYGGTGKGDENMPAVILDSPKSKRSFANFGCIIYRATEGDTKFRHTPFTGQVNIEAGNLNFTHVLMIGKAD